MQDPMPENISGEKVHVVEHEIQWGMLVWGVVALLVLLFVYDRFGDQDEEQHV